MQMEELETEDKRFCSNCGSDKTRMDRNHPRWLRYNDGYLCAKCQDRLIYNPRRSKETIKKYNDRNNLKILVFKGKRILLKENPRKGVCTRCGAIKGINCKITNMHHIRYHDDDILKDTVELCASCHSKESERIKGRYRRSDQSRIDQ
jgi:hypothetical protein